MTEDKPKRGRPPKDKTQDETASMAGAAVADAPELTPTKPSELRKSGFSVEDVTNTGIYDKKKQMAKPYWIGTLPGSPFHNFTFGGFSFPVHTYTPSKVPGGHSAQHIGNVVNMTETELRHTLTCIQAKVIRSSGNQENRKYIKKDTRGKEKRGFTPHESDMACGRFVYVVEYDENVPMHAFPQPLIT